MADVSKKEIEELKINNLALLYDLLSERKNGIQKRVLSNLGRLPNSFDGNRLVQLLDTDDESLRLLVIHNIAKLCDDTYLDIMAETIKKESNSRIRREVASAIGRMRSEKAIPVLFEILDDKDPKVTLQAVRALLVFKDNTLVNGELGKLRNHSNEMVRYVIERELKTTKETKEAKSQHTESPDYLKNVIVRGDVLETLEYVPDKSFHLTFTSPPYYNARDYSTYQSYDEYLDFLAKVFKEVHRTTKEGRFFLLNTSPILVPRFSRQYSSKRYPIPYDIHPYIVKMGWEFIDDIVWVKPEASAKNRNAGFLQHRKPLGYKPNAVTECVMVYRKKSDKLIDWSMKQYDQDTINKSKVVGEYETSNAWKIDPTFNKQHSAVFPIELCNRVISLYSYVGDLVFDPFAGSGTLGKAAINLSRYFFLTEIEAAYIENMKRELVDKAVLVEPKPRIISSEELRRTVEEAQ
ncbi:DNA methyltransferase [Chloroflexota bacterium]